MENTEEFIEQIRALVRDNRWVSLRELLVSIPEQDISLIIQELTGPLRLVVFRVLPRDLATEVFAYLEADIKDSLMKVLTEDEAREILSRMSPDDRTSFLEELPGQAIQRMTNLLHQQDLRVALRLLGYPEESVGRLMTPDYIAVRAHWSVQQALEHIRRMGKDSETVNMVYVTDSSWHLLDELDLRRLILAEPEQKIEDIMDRNVVKVYAEDDREVAVQLVQHYDLYALPVVDSRGILLGIVTVDDIIDVAEEETTEDIQIAAAVSPLKESYREATAFSLVQKRIGWLIALVFINLFASGIIAAYQDVLTAVIALVFYIPLLNAGGGNVGSQVATLVIRAQAVGEVDIEQWRPVVLKELSVGLMLGIGLGLSAFLFALVYSNISVAMVVGSSMFLNVMIVNIIGVLMPFMLLKLKLDPAMASSPLITSVADAVGLMIYLNIAIHFLVK